MAAENLLGGVEVFRVPGPAEKQRRPQQISCVVRFAPEPEFVEGFHRPAEARIEARQSDVVDAPDAIEDRPVSHQQREIGHAGNQRIDRVSVSAGLFGERADRSEAGVERVAGHPERHIERLRLLRDPIVPDQGVNGAPLHRWLMVIAVDVGREAIEMDLAGRIESLPDRAHELPGNPARRLVVPPDQSRESVQRLPNVMEVHEPLAGLAVDVARKSVSRGKDGEQVRRQVCQ